MNAHRLPLTVMLLALALGPPATAGAQQRAQDTIGAMPAPLLRRLAEAADGYRTGQPVFVAADRTEPYTVLGVFLDRTSAEQAVERAGPRYAVFGPYVTPRDPFPAEPAEVLSITVTMRSRGQTVTLPINPREADALVWSLSAFDKLVVPYYAHVYGAAETQRLREEFIRNGPTGVVWMHIYRSIMMRVPPPPPP